MVSLHWPPCTTDSDLIKPDSDSKKLSDFFKNPNVKNSFFWVKKVLFLTRYKLVTFEKLLKFWKNFWILKFPRRRKFEFSGSKKAFNLIIDPDKTVYQIEVYVVSDTKVTSKKRLYDSSLWRGLDLQLAMTAGFCSVTQRQQRLKTFTVGHHQNQKSDPESNPKITRFEMIRLLKF